MDRVEIEFREAEEKDAQSFIDFMHQVATETDFLVMDETGFSFSADEIADIFQEANKNPRELCLLACVGSEVVGAVTVKSSNQYPISHIGSVFIAIRQMYWGKGLGSILLEEIVNWAEEVGLLKRFELTVQVRNKVAIHLYQKMGFDIEGVQRRGARTNEGEWLDLYYMGRLLD